MIESQQDNTDLLTDITKLHEQHLHKLDEMVDKMNLRSLKSGRG